MQKNILIATVLGLIIVGGGYYASTTKVPMTAATDTQAGAPAQNVEIKDGVQYVTINAKGGYTPKISSIKSGVPTKIIMKTSGTFDCSSSVAIHDLGYEKILKSTGEETIDLGTLAAGKTLQGVCGMGMYNFKVVAS